MESTPLYAVQLPPSREYSVRATPLCASPLSLMAAVTVLFVHCSVESVIPGTLGGAGSMYTFAVAVWVNKGTNYWFHEVSFITNSIAAVLQLGLGIDYAIIMCHHYTEERERMEPREATIRALTLAIPEISASSLTTISGLLALSFMKIKIGEDMSLVLIKAILFLMLTVFFLMPALIMYMSPWIDRTHHRQFLPRIDALGRFAIRSRYIVPPIFLVIIIAGFVLSSKCPYVFGYSTLDTIKQNDYKIAEKNNATFGETNQVALIFPFTDYESEAGLLDDLKELKGVDRVQALANEEAKDGYMLTDSLTPRKFAELTDIDIGVSRALYTAYCTANDDYTKCSSSFMSSAISIARRSRPRP